jgi:hypothetical protein
LQPGPFEDPSQGIHRSIIHQIYVEVCILYQQSYPRFYPGTYDLLASQREQVLPAPLTGPNHLSLAVSQAAEDLQASSGHRACDIRSQQSDCVSMPWLCFSKAFPINFTEFCSRLADHLEELESE